MNRYPVQAAERQNVGQDMIASAVEHNLMERANMVCDQLGMVGQVLSEIGDEKLLSPGTPPTTQNGLNECINILEMYSEDLLTKANWLRNRIGRL